jgi:hypothetical protein
VNPLTLIDLLGRSHFQVGLGVGVVGSVMTLVLWRDLRRPIPIWGTLVSLAVVLGAALLMPDWVAPAIGVILLLAGGELLNRVPILGALVLVGAATVLALLPIVPDRVWIRTGTAAFVLAGGWAIQRVDRSLGETGIPILMIAATVFGIWATVPETEHARILVGAVAGTFLLGWPKAIARIGSNGAYALAGVMAWSIAIGGAERTGSIIGAWATLGVFFAAPLIRPGVVPKRWPVLAVHVVTVLLASRVAGLQEGGTTAAAIAIPVLIAALVVIYHLVEPSRAPDQPTA